MYPQEIVQPMKEELTSKGFEELTSPSAVDEAMKKEGTSLVVINSVCGCSAGSARPGALDAVINSTIRPTNLFTSFAGFDIDAIKQLRTYLLPYPPSSPAIALFKNGELVHMLERHMIEGRPAAMISDNLRDAFNTYCN